MSSNNAYKYPHSVLYYPFIEFKSEEWVKKALLFWDHVYRIVPEGYIPNDSATIQDLKSANLIIDVQPSNNQKANTALSFIKFYKSQLRLPSGLRDNGDGSEDHRDRLHLDKVDYRLYPLLDKIMDLSGLTRKDEWIELPPNFIRGYMYFLSQSIATDRRLVRSTDNLDAWSITPYFTERGNLPFEDIPYNKNDEGLYCSLIMENVLPKNMDEISASKIIDFNLARKEERKLFRDKVSDLVNIFPLIESKEQWNDEVGLLLKEVEDAKCEYRKSQDFMHSGMPSAIFGVGLPLGFTTLFSGEPSVKRITASFVLGAVSTITSYKKIKNDRSPSLASYLVDIDKSIKRPMPLNAICQHVSTTISKFMNK